MKLLGSSTAIPANSANSTIGKATSLYTNVTTAGVLTVVANDNSTAVGTISLPVGTYIIHKDGDQYIHKDGTLAGNVTSIANSGT